MAKKRKNKYIPHLAEFYFKPDDDWGVREAKKLYSQNHQSEQIPGGSVDCILYQNCIDGMETIPDSSVDLVIADPPFGIDFSGKEAIYNRDSDNVVEDYHEVEDNYSRFTHRWISHLPRIMKKKATAFIFSGYTNLKEVLNAVDSSGLELINHIIWKYQFGVFTKRKFVTSHYHVLFLAKDPDNYYFNRIEHYNEDVWVINRKYHTGQKKNGTKLPLKVVQKCINFASKPGDLVFDPFMGNGTTAVASKRTYRHYLGFEMNEKLRPIIEHNLSSVRLGSAYNASYGERLPSLEDLGKQSGYKRAYKEYLKREEN